MITMRHGWILAVALTVAACASPGPVPDPAGLKLTWFSYLNGDDLRDRCIPGEQERYRLVFNADYNEHVRTYEVTGDLAGGGAEIEARVIKAADLSRVDLANPMAPWQAEVSRTRLSPRQFAVLVLHLYESGAFRRDAEGLRLPSNGFYWLVSGCRGGEWFFSAYPYPSDRFANIRFDEALRAIDETGVAFPALPAPEDAPRRIPARAWDGDEGRVYFELTVGRDGLIGPTHLFGAWPRDIGTLSAAPVTPPAP